jgi:hypothetical protein
MTPSEKEIPKVAFNGIAARPVVRHGRSMAPAKRRDVEAVRVSPRQRQQGEVSVSALGFLLMLNAIVFAYDHSRMWWREKISGRVTRRLSSIDP